VRRYSNLLVERGCDRNGFLHLTFQEYLAASDIFNRTQGDLDLVWDEIDQEDLLYDAHWQEVILLLLAMLGKVDKGRSATLLLERILQAGDQDLYEEVSHRNLYLCGRAIADQVHISQSLKSRIIQSLLVICRESMPWEVDRALSLLSKLQGDKEVATGLLKIAYDPQSDIRSLAVKALGYLGCTEDNIIHGLLELTQGPRLEYLIHRAAAEALKDLGYADEIVIKGLLELGNNSYGDGFVRCSAAEALIKAGYTKEATHILLELVRDKDTYEKARRFAVEALIRLDNIDDAAQALLELVHYPYLDNETRIATSKLLVEVGHTEEAAQTLSKLARDVKVSDKVRHEAASSLGELGHSNEAAHLLLELACDVKIDCQARGRAAESLGKLDEVDDSIIHGLMELACNASVHDLVRADAAKSLGIHGNTKCASQILLQLACDLQVDNLIRRGVVWALGDLRYANDMAVTRGLLQLLHDEHVEDGVRGLVAISLDILGHANRAAKILLELASDARFDSFSRERCARVLGSLDCAGDDILDGLLELVCDVKVPGSVRTAAAESLGALGYPDDSAEILLEIARDSQVDSLTRSIAYRSLNRLLE
jgi:uncharacterized protein (UPF0147 family)